MSEFPFTEAEWAVVDDRAAQLVSATLANDEILGASCREGLFDCLQRLREKYGEHCILLETEADFTDDDADRIRLYRRAIQAAMKDGWQTLSIRLSLAGVLLEQGDRAEARAELLACQNEIPSVGDECDQQKWAELLAQAEESPG